MVLLLALLLLGRQVVHETGGLPVVTLADRDRSDPFEFRYVIVNAKTEEFSLVVDRYEGRVWICDKRMGNEVAYTPDGRIKLGDCVMVYDGPVTPH